jgi:hypothetical protein
MRFSVVTASHDTGILHANLARSPLFAAGVPLHVEHNAPSATIAYNRGLDATTAPYIVFAHHDVFLPLGWDRLLAARIAAVEAQDPNWALIGAFGIGLDGAHTGPVWSSSLGMIVGRVPLSPLPVQSFDEMLIVLRRASGLRWDQSLPGWHMYGTDIVQAARAQGMASYAAGLPCIHNDRYHGALGQDFTDCYRFIQRKWRGTLPLRTPITKISRSGLHLMRDRWQARGSRDFRADMAVGTDTAVEVLAARCGWGDVTGSV